MKKTKETRTLYVRNLTQENYTFVKEQADKNGYCPSTLLNRILNFVKKETKLEML